MVGLQSWKSAAARGKDKPHDIVYAYSSGVKNLREFSGLDVDAIMQDMEERNYVRLKQAILELDLELWLTDHDLGSALPVLLKEGYTSRRQLYTMDLEKAQKVGGGYGRPVHGSDMKGY